MRTRSSPLAPTVHCARVEPFERDAEDRSRGISMRLSSIGLRRRNPSSTILRPTAIATIGALRTDLDTGPVADRPPRSAPSCEVAAVDNPPWGGLPRRRITGRRTGTVRGLTPSIDVWNNRRARGRPDLHRLTAGVC